jgi:hypothetical protein
MKYLFFVFLVTTMFACQDSSKPKIKKTKTEIVMEENSVKIVNQEFWNRLSNKRKSFLR